MAELQSAYNALSTSEKLLSFVGYKDNTKYDIGDIDIGRYVSSYATDTAISIYALSITNATLVHGSVNSSGWTGGDDSSSNVTGKLYLYTFK